jgi:hypothetical protein
MNFKMIFGKKFFSRIILQELISASLFIIKAILYPLSATFHVKCAVNISASFPMQKKCAIYSIKYGKLFCVLGKWKVDEMTQHIFKHFKQTLNFQYCHSNFFVGSQNKLSHSRCYLYRCNNKKFKEKLNTLAILKNNFTAFRLHI